MEINYNTNNIRYQCLYFLFVHRWGYHCVDVYNLLKTHTKKTDLNVKFINLSSDDKNAEFYVDAFTIRSRNPLEARNGNIAPITGTNKYQQ